LANVAGCTPLHTAFSKDSLSGGGIGGTAACVRLLLAAGADSGARRRDGVTPLMCAAERGDMAALYALLGCGRTAGPSDVKLAYRARALEWHPDRLPAGFTFIAGTAQVNGVRIADPVGGRGPVLAFNLGAMPASKQLVLQYRVRVGVGSQQGDGLNRARAHACALPAGCVGADGRTPLASSVATNEGQYRVRVTGGVFSDAACVAGKVFVDCNGNHVQDSEELGIPGVRLVLQDGTALVSDSEGKYSMCGLPPKSHVLRVDVTTLPRGARLTTSSNRNLGDAGSLWLDIKNGELHRADVIEGSCSNTVLEQVKARRAQGEVRAAETERDRGPALRFDSKAHGLDTFSSPAQGTDGANQAVPKPRGTSAPAPGRPGDPPEPQQPTPALPMNQPPPSGRPTGTAPQGGSDATR
jgi:hypothetical protein